MFSGRFSPHLWTEHESREPILFVFLDGGKFRLSVFAREMLMSLEDPVAIVSVCGRRWTGKSFVLKQLLESSDGHKATSDLWLRRSPLWRITPDGTSYDILFLHTRGIDEHLSSIQMAGLAFLLSSTVIYNQMGSIDDVALHLLCRVIEYSKLIHLQASKQKDADSMQEQNCPSLLWLLRDVVLGMVEDNMVTPRDYLEHMLGRVEIGGSSIADALNKMRDSIKAFFPDRACCSLVNPVVDKNDLGRLDQITSKRLRPEFIAGLAILKTYVLEMTRPKQVGGKMMTGRMLVRITEMYLDDLNIGLLDASWQSTIEHGLLREYELAESYFFYTFDSLESKTSKAWLESFLEEVIHIFTRNVCQFSGPFCEIYRSCLKSALEKKILEHYRNCRELPPESIAPSNPANEREDASVGKFIAGPWTSGLSVGSVSRHCEAENHQECLSFGLRPRRKQFDARSQEGFVGDGRRMYKNGMGLDSSPHVEYKLEGCQK